MSSTCFRPKLFMSIRKQSGSDYEPMVLSFFVWPFNSCGQSVLTFKVKILPYRPPARLVRTKSSPLPVKVERRYQYKANPIDLHFKSSCCFTLSLKWVLSDLTFHNIFHGSIKFWTGRSQHLEKFKVNLPSSNTIYHSLKKFPSRLNLKVQNWTWLEIEILK